MDTWQIILIAVAGALGLIVLILLGVILAGRASRHKDKVGKVKVIDGVRYTPDENVTDGSGAVKATFTREDVMLARGKEYLVQRNGRVMPGKYTVLMADETVTEANIRVGGFVRPYKHKASIVLAEGDKVCATSHAVVLR
ncbi:MAG: hypothetical protein LBP26_00780 [Clostridiales bacterium]|jgi:hypothetical protein|nr:hypothetical protein [Clostridiales bacterium]